MNKFIQVVSLFFTCLLCDKLTSGAWSVVLDSEQDAYSRNWNIDGHYQYYNSGADLRILQSYLPKDFNYANFRLARGLWTILQDRPSFVKDQAGPVQVTNATFGFSSFAQLVESVDIRYCVVGGPGTQIMLKNSVEKNPIYTIPGTPTPTYALMNIHIPVNPTSRFVVECQVYGPDDFILIDRIQANYMEATTTTTAPTTTTTTTRTTTTASPAPTADPVVSGSSSLLSSKSIFPWFILLSTLFCR